MRREPVRVGRRTSVLMAIAGAITVLAFGWPLVIEPVAGVEHAGDAPLLFALVIPLVMALVVSQMSDGGMDAKAVAMLGVLSALGAGLRPLGAGIGGIEPVFFLLIIAGRVFGPGFGFVVGATTLLASGLLTGGVGPWLPFQMLAAAWVGLGAGLLPRAAGRTEIGLLAAYGVVSSLLFGLAMNLSFWPFTLGPDTAVSFMPGAPIGDNLRRFLLFDLTTSLGWDVGRSITTALLVLVFGSPILRILRRAARRAAFDRPVVFVDPAQTPAASPASVSESIS